MTKTGFTSYCEDAKKIHIGSFSHSSNIHEIASLINEKYVQTNLQKESGKRKWGYRMMNWNKVKCLIVYFSRDGNNYVSGKIVNLPVGNIEVIADMVREMTGRDLFLIDTVKSYPRDYTQPPMWQKRN